MIISKTFTFNAGHRLKDYDGCCSNVHGHNFRCTICVQGDPEDNGMVIDFVSFNQIKKRIDQYFDHSFMYEK